MSFLAELIPKKKKKVFPSFRPPLPSGLLRRLPSLPRSARPRRRTQYPLPRSITSLPIDQTATTTPLPAINKSTDGCSSGLDLPTHPKTLPSATPASIESGGQLQQKAMTTPVVSPEDVLETLMNDGTIDAIRLKIINHLKANEALKKDTISMVEQSKVLNTPGAEKQTKRELFDALRQELETPVLEKASRAVWEIILDSNGLGKEIGEIVGKTFFRLSGQELPIPPAQNGVAQMPREEGDTEGKKEEQKDKDAEKEREKERGTPDSSSRKRTFDEMKNQERDSATNETLPLSENGATIPSSSKI